MITAKGYASECLLGLFEGEYSGGTVKFASGDLFIFYTDGVTEAMNHKREMYGSERLVSAAEKLSGLSAKKMSSKA